MPEQKDTCEKEKCPFWKLIASEGKPCPMYVSVTFTPNKGGQPYNVQDCAPIRTILMIQDLYNRMIGIQQSQEKLRNEAVWVQVVAEVLGKNSGVDLSAFVEERIRLQNIETIKQITKGDNNT